MKQVEDFRNNPERTFDNSENPTLDGFCQHNGQLF